MSTPMDVDEVPPAQQEQADVKGKTKDVAEKKRFEVKKVSSVPMRQDPQGADSYSFLVVLKWNAVALWAWGKYENDVLMQRAYQ